MRASVEVALAAEPKSRADVLFALLQELRPKQWIKNFACLAGLIFSGRLLVAGYVANAAIAFAAFCCASSAVYILNDLLDRERDRQSPRTAARPLASGELPVWVALVAIAVLVAGAGWGSIVLGWACVSIITLYGAINVFYSLRLKQTVIADVMCIAMGFVLRVLYGSYAVENLPTAWIVLCTFCLALFLGFAKRKAELSNSSKDASRARLVLNKYSVPYLELLVVMCATMTIMAYALFTVASHKNPSLVVTIVPVIYCIIRYLHHVMILGRGQSPEDILLGDKMLWLGILAWLAICVLVLYTDVQLFVETRPGITPFPGP